jgi:S1-C subfamily serine protease
MRKRHKVAVGTFTTLTIIFMIITGVVLNGVITGQAIENRALKNRIAELEGETNDKINELAATIINNKQSSDQELSEVSKDIGTLKATNLEDFTTIIEQAIKSTTAVRTLKMQGSGMIIDKQGYIATNLHILVTETELSKIIQVLTSDGKIHDAKIIGFVADLDLALLKINSTYEPFELEPTENVQTGDRVIAIGNPEGFQFSATDGIVSAKNRIGYNGIDAYIQTNAELNQGNSGGPLINKEGKAIGMNNFKLADAEGIGFALDANTLKEGINQITLETTNQTILN